MVLKWVDSLEIAIELDETYPDVDPKAVNFVDLRQWIMDLDGFDDDPEHSGERILEAVQLAWMEEKED
jgi:FeS assembly protein IscX